MKVRNMTKVVVLLVQSMMLPVLGWKWENSLTIVIIWLQTIYLQPMQQQIICRNEALLWLEQWDKIISYSICQMKLLLLSQRLEKKVYYRKERYLAISYQQKQSQNKPVIMLSTFCSAFDVPHRKKADKTIPAIVDGGCRFIWPSDLFLHMCRIVFNLLSWLHMNSYILCKLTVRNPKSRLEFIMLLTPWLLSLRQLLEIQFNHPHLLKS